MKTIQGPAIFLAQFMGDEAPFNTLDNITTWVASIGYKGVQIPSWDSRCIELQQAVLLLLKLNLEKNKVFILLMELMDLYLMQDFQILFFQHKLLILEKS